MQSFLRNLTLGLILGLCLGACDSGEVDYGPEVLDNEGAAIDSAPVERVEVETAPIEATFDGKYREIGIDDLTLEDLGEEGLSDLLDAQLFPDEYTEEERMFPKHVRDLDGVEVALRGYMIPTHTEEGRVMSFMLVGDLLACCFGGAPRKDQWVNVEMAEGEGCEYYAYVPMVAKGTLRIEVIEDRAGYPTGCYQMVGVEVRQE